MKRVVKIITITIFLAALMIQLVHAQSKMQETVLNGRGQPLPNVNVLLLKSTDSALVKGIVSGNSGLKYYLIN
jgi:hypothetical protein